MTWWSLASFLRMYSTQTFYQHTWGTSREIQYNFLKVDFQKCKRFIWRFDLISFKYTRVSKSQFLENLRYLFFTQITLIPLFFKLCENYNHAGQCNLEMILKTAVISLWNSFWFRKNRNLFEKVSFLTFRNYTVNQFFFLSMHFLLKDFKIFIYVFQFLQEDWL